MMLIKHAPIVILLLSAFGLSTSPTGAAEKPNILFIAIDDLNDWVAPLSGHPQVKTPYMDRLAAKGTTFTNAHCQAPLCNPSRTSLMTGLRPSTTGIYGLAPWIRNVKAFEDWATLPQYLAKYGYTNQRGTLYGGRRIARSLSDIGRHGGLAGKGRIARA